MNLLPVISTLAIVLGLAGVLPQIVAMVTRRSAAGQSTLGWTLGVAVNAMMAYVNLAGYGALALALGNVAGGLLCAVALACTMRLPKVVEPPAVAVARPDPLDLSTGDLSEMLEALAGERERRERARREAAAAVEERELAAA
jgi:hypothetical protein